MDKGQVPAYFNDFQTLSAIFHLQYKKMVFYQPCVQVWNTLDNVAVHAPCLASSKPHISNVDFSKDFTLVSRVEISEKFTLPLDSCMTSCIVIALFYLYAVCRAKKK